LVVQQYHAQAFFAKNDSKSERSLASTPIHGGDTFGKKLIRNHRFSSSRLNLASEGLLLGVSLHLRVKGYLKQPQLAGAQDSKPLHTLVRITDHVFIGVPLPLLVYPRGEVTRKVTESVTI
jgi:hypothetical protein